MNRDQALAIVDSLYAAALGEAEWHQALARVADGLGGSAATLEIHDIANGKLLAFDSARLDPATIPVYIRDFVWRNPRTRLLSGAGALLTFDHLFITEEEMDRHPFYADFLRPADLRYFTAAQTSLIDGRVKGVLAVQRSGRVRGGAPGHIEDMRLLAPHISRAMTLYWKRMWHDIDPGHMDCVLAGYGLTPAERRLAAAILFGEALPEYAKRTGLSINTVYTHYRRVKDKLGLARQVELVARLHALCGQPPVSPNAFLPPPPASADGRPGHPAISPEG